MYCFWSLYFLYFYPYNFLPPASLGSTASCSSRALKYVNKSFTWDLSDFLVWAPIAINFCIKIALAISQRLKFKWKHRKIKDFDLNLKTQEWTYPVQNLDLYGTTMWVLEEMAWERKTKNELYFPGNNGRPHHLHFIINPINSLQQKLTEKPLDTEMILAHTL